MSPSHPLILLLKSPSPTLSLDPYTTTLSPPFPPPLYIPLLSHTLLPDPLISLLLLHLSQHTPTPTPFPYGALILTSQRSVAALSSALSAPAISEKEEYKARLKNLRVRLYTVGPATEKAVREVRDRWLNPDLCGVYGGGKAGSGEVLARLMLTPGDENKCHYDIRSSDEDTSGVLKPVLFLVGEKRRDVIPRMLQSTELEEGKRVKVDEMVVYKTSEMESFGFEFGKVLRATEGGEEGRWVVVFSPMLRGLGWWDEGRRGVRQGGEGRGRTWVCCIGPTTREYLEREFGLVADVVAERPSAEGVREAIERFMREREEREKGV